MQKKGPGCRVHSIQIAGQNIQHLLFLLPAQTEASGLFTGQKTQHPVISAPYYETLSWFLTWLKDTKSRLLSFTLIIQIGKLKKENFIRETIDEIFSMISNKSQTHRDIVISNWS